MIKGTLITGWAQEVDPDTEQVTYLPQLLVDFPGTKYDDVTGGDAIPAPNAFVAAYEMSDEDFNAMYASGQYTVLTSEVVA